MSQDNFIKLQCTVCKRITHSTTRNKKLKIRLELMKGCKFCGREEEVGTKHTLHKETK